MIRIDLEKGTVTVTDGKGEKAYPLQSAEAFSIVSQAWLRCGWDTKYVYGFTGWADPSSSFPRT